MTTLGSPPRTADPSDAGAPTPSGAAARPLPWAVAILTGVLCAAVPLARYRRWSTPSWDNAIFEQAVQGYSRLGAPISDIKGPGYNLLGDHFSPILVTLAPFYRAFPDPRTLMVAQAVLVAIAVGVVARAGAAHLGAWSGAAIGAACGLSFGVQQAVNVDFHEVAFSAPLLALAGEAYLRRRWNAVIGWSLPLLLVNEELGVTVGAIGVVLVLMGARRRGAALVLAGGAAVALTVMVLIPAANPAGHYDYLGHLGTGGDPFGMLHTAWRTKLETLTATFAVAGFVALRSPWALVAVPTLAWRFVGDNSSYWGTGWHYSLGLMPIVFVALIDTLARLRRGRHPAWLEAPARAMPALVLAGALIAGVHGPFATVLRPSAWQVTPQARDAAAAMASIPPGVSVESDLGLLTHLVQRDRVYWSGNTAGVVPQVVVRQDAGPDAAARVMAGAIAEHPGTRWRVLYDAVGYVVIGLDGPGGVG